MSNVRTSVDQSLIVNLFRGPVGQPVNQPQVVIQQMTTLADADGVPISQMPVPLMAVADDFNDERLAAINEALGSVGLIVARAR